MRKSYILFILSFVSFSTFAQTLQPTETEALLLMLIVNNDEQPISTEVAIISKTNRQVYKVKSNAEGIAELLIPINDTYSINLKGEPNYDEIIIPNEANYGLQYQIYYDENRKVDFDIATINYRLRTSTGKPLSETVTLINVETNEETTFTTDENGNAVVKLKNNFNYSINYTSVTDYDVLTIPNVENLTMNFNASYEGSSEDVVYPNNNEALFVLRYYGFDSLPVPNEVFTIVAASNHKTYTGTTNEKGEAKILVPVGDTYQMNATYFENFQVTTIAKDAARSLTIGSFYFISSIDYEKRLFERKRAAEVWDSLARIPRVRDSIITIHSEIGGFATSLLNEKSNNVFTNMRKRATQDSTLVANDSTYFEKIGYEISAVLYRNRGRWKNKIIVTDLTGSMYPYLDQILSWHILDYNSSVKNQYLFFNDGDKMPDYQKVIGKTGGLYYSDAKSLEDLSQIMIETMNGGSGADSPENDVEALLRAIELRKNRRTEIILIADNYSDMRDYKLLSKLNVPVRVILAGSKNSANEQYLELAYKTKGSVHTLEEDLENLFELNNGDNIRINGITYRVKRGKFFIVRE